MQSVIVFVNSLDDSQTVEGTLRLVIFILVIAESHHDLCEVIGVLVFLEIVENIECSLLGLDGLVEILGFRVHFSHLKIGVTELFLLQKRVTDLKLFVNQFNVFKLLDGLVEFLLLRINIWHNGENGCVTHVVSAKNLHVHLERFFKKRKCIFVITSLHVASSQKCQDLRMVLLSFLMLLEKRPIQLECRSQMVESLLVIFVVEIWFAELRVGSYQDEKVFSMNVYKDFAHSELLDSYLDLPIEVLAHEHFVKLVSFVDYSKRID